MAAISLSADPISALASLATTALELEKAVWDAAPADLKTKVASDVFTFIHSVGQVIINLQARLNALAGIAGAAIPGPAGPNVAK